jgi:folate-binding Fe-S cluster repair protein YgfZ
MGCACQRLLVTLANIMRSGVDAPKFLQGMITNDIRSLLERNDAMYTAFLNGKGRTMFEGHVVVGLDPASASSPAAGGPLGFLIDVHHADLDALLAHLKRYKLRSSVAVSDVSSQLAVAAVLPKSLLLVPNEPRLGRFPANASQAEQDMAATGMETALRGMLSARSGGAGAVFLDRRCPAALGARCVVPTSNLSELSQALQLNIASEDIYSVFRMFLGLPEGCALLAVLLTGGDAAVDSLIVCALKQA